jgi:3-polyprenyl-4-hydroxybenzoate decarboxylase
MLENALRVSREGGIIAPIMPPFYHRPQTLDEVVAGFTEKLLALCGAEAGPGWREDRLAPGELATRPGTPDNEGGAE